MWSKNIFKEEGRFEARISECFDRFKVRKFRVFAGLSGHVFGGLNRIFNPIFRVQVVEKHCSSSLFVVGRLRTKREEKKFIFMAVWSLDGCLKTELT